MKTAVVLLSGGIDSAVCLAIAKDIGFEVHALTIDYAQRHNIEIDAAKRVAEHFGVCSHIVLHAPIHKFCRVPLIGCGPIPTDRTVTDIMGGISPVYVPARNSILLAFALSLAEVKNAESIYIGCNQDDAAGFPDCRYEFLKAWEQIANIGICGPPVKVRAPLINLTKQQVVENGNKYKVPFDLTISCYQPSHDGTPCNKCDACILRNHALNP
jgi:7-cyano-7-deazaguanine synthase